MAVRKFKPVTPGQRNKVITVNEINTYAIMNANSLVLVDGVQDILASRIRR